MLRAGGVFFVIVRTFRRFHCSNIISEAELIKREIAVILVNNELQSE